MEHTQVYDGHWEDGAEEKRLYNKKGKSSLFFPETTIFKMAAMEKGDGQ